MGRFELGQVALSYEYRAVVFSRRSRNALRPAARMRRRFVSSSTRLMFTALQLLVGFLGVNRFM